MKNIFLYRFNFRLALIVLIMFVFAFDGVSQRPGKAFRIGKDAFENNEHIRAIGWLTIAIDAQKQKFNEAYIYRAESYEALNRGNEAIKDYIAATKLFPERAELKLKTARILYEKENYLEALQFATSTLDIDSANFEALKIQSLALTHIGNAESGLLISDQAAEIKEDAELLYAKALASDSLGLIDYAIAYYNEAISINKSFKPPYHDMGKLLVRNNYYDKAIEIFSQACREFNDADSYRLRSLLYGAMGKTLAQISDLTKILTLEPTRIDLYFERAEQYKKENLLQNALSDISYYIEWDPYSPSAWLLKGQLLEELYMISKAIEAYDNVVKYSDDEIKTSYAKQGIFRLKKEKFPPKIVIISPPGPDDSSISLGKTQNKVLIRGKVEDASSIAYVLVNGRKPDTTSSETGVDFSIQLNIDTASAIFITASDVYNNVVSNSYKILRVEKDPPLLYLQEPLLNEDSAIVVTQSQLNINGFFYEASGLKWLKINGKEIQPQVKDSKYYFNDKLDILNNDSLIIEVSDYFSNEITHRYKLLRSDTIQKLSSPLGKTWYVVVVSDSIGMVLPEIRQYKKDLIEKLLQYDLDSLVVLDGLSKEQIERKLLFELPEAARQNRIETMILHMVAPGITKGEFSYWITPNYSGQNRYSLLNTSILRTYFNANQFIPYKTVISESVEVGSNVFGEIDDCECTNCADIQSFPEEGQFVLNIKVKSWHQYESPYLKMLNDAILNQSRCFSPSVFADKTIKGISAGKIKGQIGPPFPAIIYLRK